MSVLIDHLLIFKQTNVLYFFKSLFYHCKKNIISLSVYVSHWKNRIWYLHLLVDFPLVELRDPWLDWLLFV